MENGWVEYFEKTKNKPPRRLLLEALAYVKEKELALDIGSGALNESKYLLSHGFKKVIALDKEPIAKETAGKLPSDRFEYIISSIEKYSFPFESYDLVNAQYVLPFITQENFNNVWMRIAKSLKREGIFTGQLFGEKDGWAGKENMNFHTQSQAKILLDNFKILKFIEEESDRPTAMNSMKHWHVFHFIIRK